MHVISGRTTARIGAGVAMVLLFMQLRSEGADGYDMGDVLSILVAVLPVLFHGARVQTPRGSPRDVGTDDDGEVTASDADAPPAAAEVDGLQQLLSDGAAWLLTVVSWLLAVGLVVLQAWPAALSAMIIFLVAASSITPAPSATREPTSTGGGADRP
jgi:hypothetical protein